MNTALIGISILEMTSGGLHEVCEIETERITDSEDQKQLLTELTESLYTKDDFFATLDSGVGVVIRGLKNKTIVLRGVFEGLPL